MSKLDLYSDTCRVVKEIKPYYDVDKIKFDSVYIWSKPESDDDFGVNLFDITADGITYYVKDHVIPQEVMPIIQKIQLQLKENRKILGR